MWKRNLGIAAVVLIAAATAAYWYFSGKVYVVRITQAQIAQQVSSRFPLTRDVLPFVSATLSNARVQLKEGSHRINAGIDVEVNARMGNQARSLHGSVDISGGIRYDPSVGAFFLTDPVIEALSVEGLPPRQIKPLQFALAQLLSQQFAGKPVYTLNTTDARQAAGRMLLRDMVIDNGEVVLKLGW